MKNIFNIIIINLIVILITVISMDIVFFYNLNDGLEKNDWLSQYVKDTILTKSAYKYYSALYKRQPQDNSFVTGFRKDYIRGMGKPILYMGCSFTWGDGLDDENTVSAKTARLTKRSVFNRGGKGWGLSQMLYQLKRQDLIKTIPEPEYLIYIYITDHLGRIDKYKVQPWCGNFEPRYKLDKNKNLVQMKPSVFDYLYITNYYLYTYSYSQMKKRSNNDEILDLYFNEALKQMRKYWKNTKFVIVKWPIAGDNELYHSNIFEKLKNDGFIIVPVEDIVNVDLRDNKYKVDDGWHPSSAAWDIALPKILDYLNIEYNK